MGGIMTESTVPQTNSQNEHIMAALSHATALIPMMGVIAPIIIWVTQKDKSEYVSFQSLQAIIYQFLMIITYFIGIGCYFLSMPVMFIFMFLGMENFPEVGAIFPVFIMIVIFGGGGIFILYGLIATVMTFLGKDFRYILIGKWLERYLMKQEQPK
jgi:uncharacterized Tic20 family protein